MNDWIPAERLSRLIALIYDCAVDPALWPTAMEAIRTELNFHNATLDLVLLPSGKARANVTCGVPPEYAAVIDGAGPDVMEQWGGTDVLMNLPLDRPAVLTRVNPDFDPETSTNRYYVNFAKPQGLVDVMTIGLARDARAVGAVSFGRHAGAGPIGEREVAIAHLLVPHLQRAATINRMLEEAVSARASFSAAIDKLSVPVFLLDAQLSVLHANPVAQALLEIGSIVKIDNGALHTTTPVASRALASAIAQATRDESAIGRRGLGIPVSDPDGNVGALHVLPLRGRHMRNDQGAVAAVFIAQASTPFVAPTEMVAALFDLTRSEARVFEHVVTGHTQAATADALGVERSTVKTHLMRIFDKTGVRRQADLVRVAALMAIPITG